MGIKIVMPSLPGEARDVYKAIQDALATLKISDEIIDVDMELVSIRIDGRSGKPTKGELIWDAIRDCVDTGDYRTRQQIANDADATVSRVQEILKANQGSAEVRQYRRMAEAAKLAKWEIDNEEGENNG